jgi:HEAT repeat protein
MTGQPGPRAGVDEIGLSILELVSALESDPFTRLNAIYTLASLGDPAIGPLRARLEKSQECGWSESAVVMESAAYALAALGEPAVPALIEMLEHSVDWVQINALFALGEIGPAARAALPAILNKLRHPAHQVARTALDSLGHMQAGNEALPEIRRLLTETNPDWQEPLYRKWTGENQVRINAIMALLRTPDPSRGLLDTVANSLNDPCGYVGGFGTEILLRHPTPDGMRAAIAHLQTHRWDNSLNRGIRTY